MYWGFTVALLSSRPDHIFGWNYNVLTTLDFFKAITWAEDWNIFNYTSKKQLIRLTLGNKPATFTAIPLEFYDKIVIYTFQFWKTFLLVTPVTCFTTSLLVLWSMKTEAGQA